jgi:hypothetical protein
MMKQIRAEVARRYMLTYTPAGPSRPGRWPKVRATEDDPSGRRLLVRTRSGYHAGSGRHREREGAAPLTAAGPRKTHERAIGRHAAALSAAAFALHLAWEYAQCGAFFVHSALTPTTANMLAAAAGDVLMTWAAYAAVALRSGRWLWVVGPWTRRHWITFGAAALVMSFGVEAAALSSGSWGYTELNPRIPGTPVSRLPVAQFLVLLPVSFAVSRLAVTGGASGAAGRETLSGHSTLGVREGRPSPLPTEHIPLTAPTLDPASPRGPFRNLYTALA